MDLVGQVIQENEDRSEVYDAAHLPFTVFHKPILGRREVRLHYLMTTDSDGTFQAPPGEPNDQYTGMMRVRTMGLVLRSANRRLHRVCVRSHETDDLLPCLSFCHVPLEHSR